MEMIHKEKKFLASTIEILALYVDLNERKVAEFEDEKVKLMDEFINNNEDVLATLNYPCQESTEYWQTPYFEIAPGIYDHGNINADVVCFNNPAALKKIIDISDKDIDDFIDQFSTQQLEGVLKFFDTMPKVRHEIKYKNSNGG